MYERSPEVLQRAGLTRADLARRVQAVLARTLGVEPERVTPDARLEDDLGMDSLKTIETNVALEEEIGFTAPEVARPDELGIHTVEDLVSHVTRVLAGDPR